MFWGYLWPHRFCAEAPNNYMWVNLIYSMVIVVLGCYLQLHSYVSQKENENENKKIVY